MDRLGYILIGIGFLAGSWFAVADAESVVWWGEAIALLVGFIGVRTGICVGI